MLRDGLREYLAVRQPLKPLVAKVNHLMSLLAQPCGNADIHAHVQQKSHEQVSPPSYPKWTCSWASHAA